MTYGSEPGRRRWSSDSSRRAGESRRSSESRRTSEADDAEDWLAGFRPDPADAERDAFSGVAPAFGHSAESGFSSSESAFSPSSDRPFPGFEELPKRPGRRRREDPEPSVELRPDRRFGAAERESWDFGAPERASRTESASGSFRVTAPEAPTRDRRAAPDPDDRASTPMSVDPIRPTWPDAWQERPSAPAATPGRHSAPLPSADDELTVRGDDRPLRGRRRAPEPDDLPSPFPTRPTATASIPVAGASRPPAPPTPPAAQASTPAPPSRRRATATARVTPPATARASTTGDIRRRSFEDSGPIRRGAETSGPIRRGAETSGPIRRLPHESTGSVGRVSRQTAGQRAPARRSARTLPTWLSRVLVVVTVLVLALVGLGGYMLINGRRSSAPTKQPASGAQFKGRDISSQTVDPVAMTEAEVFPGKQVAVRSTTYPVLRTQAGDCGTAATDDLAKLLTDLGCSQVVRGTLKSADSQFLITAGIFNLKDEASANKAYETIKPTLDAQKGRFTGLAAGDGTEAIVRAPTTLGWHPLGHFLAYCIVARADGKPISADDAGSKQVISDVVEGYLRDNVLAARSAGTAGTPK